MQYPKPKQTYPTTGLPLDFARHDRPVPAKGWDEVGPDHPFLSVRIQVPLRPCLEVVLPQ
jgi:hypothetical protein